MEFKRACHLPYSTLSLTIDSIELHCITFSMHHCPLLLFDPPSPLLLPLYLSLRCEWGHLVPVYWLFLIMPQTKQRNTESDRAIRARQQNTARVFSPLFVCLKQMKPAGAPAYIRGHLVTDNTLIWREIDPGR